MLENLEDTLVRKDPRQGQTTILLARNAEGYREMVPDMRGVCHKEDSTKKEPLTPTDDSSRLPDAGGGC